MGLSSAARPRRSHQGHLRKSQLLATTGTVPGVGLNYRTSRFPAAHPEPNPAQRTDQTTSKIFLKFLCPHFSSPHLSFCRIPTDIRFPISGDALPEQRLVKREKIPGRPFGRMAPVLARLSGLRGSVTSARSMLRRKPREAFGAGNRSPGGWVLLVESSMPW